MGGGAPFDQSQMGQGGSAASVDKLLSIAGSSGAGNMGSGADGRSTERGAATSLGGAITDTRTWMVELPDFFPISPTTIIVKVSFPPTSVPAEYMNPYPCNAIRPSCGLETSFTLSTATLAKRSPRTQLWPLWIAIDQWTVSAIRLYCGPLMLQGSADATLCPNTRTTIITLAVRMHLKRFRQRSIFSLLARLLRPCGSKGLILKIGTMPLLDSRGERHQ